MSSKNIKKINFYIKKINNIIKYIDKIDFLFELGYLFK